MQHSLCIDSQHCHRPLEEHNDTVHGNHNGVFEEHDGTVHGNHNVVFEEHNDTVHGNHNAVV